MSSSKPDDINGNYNQINAIKALTDHISSASSARKLVLNIANTTGSSLLRHILITPSVRPHLNQTLYWLILMAIDQQQPDLIDNAIPDDLAPHECDKALELAVMREQVDIVDSLVLKGARPTDSIMRTLAETYNTSPTTTGNRLLTLLGPHYDWRRMSGLSDHHDCLDLVTRALERCDKALLVMASANMSLEQQYLLMDKEVNQEQIQLIFAHMHISPKVLMCADDQAKAAYLGSNY